jgi:hypothetical protein
MGENENAVDLARHDERIKALERRADKADARIWQIAAGVISLIIAAIWGFITGGKL